MSEVQAKSSTLTVTDGEEWRSAIAKAFLPMTAESLPSTGFFGRIDAIDTDDFSIARVTSMPQNINRTALACRRTPTDMIKVLIQRRGSHRIDQGEHRTSAAAGSLTAYNTDVPYALTLPQQFCADVIMVPRSRLKFVENAIDDVHKSPLTLEYGTAALLSQHVDQLMTRTDEIPTDSAIRMANLAIDMLAVVLGDVATADRPSGVLLDTVRFWIRRHLADETLIRRPSLARTVSRCATSTDCSPARTSRYPPTFAENGCYSYVATYSTHSSTVIPSARSGPGGALQIRRI